MKYIVMIGDGMADYPVEALGGKTPLEVAVKPRMDDMARNGIVGFVHNVPVGMVPESDTANLAVMGYDPKVYSKGRSPLEAVSMGIDMKEDETAFRINTVALTEGDVYEEQTILDHSADEIPTAESRQLVETLEKELGDDIRTYYPGVSYRHCLIWKNAPALCDFTRPHDILGRKIGEYLPKGEVGAPYLDIMKKSYEILKNHPVNLDRKKRGLLPANSLWIWGPGKKPQLTSFADRYGLKATVISAVDLIKGIGLCAGMNSVDVEGATGNIHTNFAGKAKAAADALLLDGQDYVYVHIEAPDESGHRAELENKIKSIEEIDKVIAYIEKRLTDAKEDYRILVLPDHPTPLALRTHTIDAVPYVLYDSRQNVPSDAKSYDEHFGVEDISFVSTVNYAHGENLMDALIVK